MRTSAPDGGLPSAAEVPDDLADEFAVRSAWTVDAVADLGPEHAVPAACQGTSPAVVEWLLHRQDPEPGTVLLDVGAGLGGPAEHAAHAAGVEPVLVDPVGDSCAAARQLFGRPSVTADGGSLPFADQTAPLVWSLGVLCTVPDKEAHVREAARVLSYDGSLGLLVFERQVDELPEQPRGNTFPTADEVEGLLHDAGLEVLDSVPLADLEPAPAEWSRAAHRVDQWIAQHHGADPRWLRSQRQTRILDRILSEGWVAGRVLWARRARQGDG